MSIYSELFDKAIETGSKALRSLVRLLLGLIFILIFAMFVIIWIANKQHSEFISNKPITPEKRLIINNNQVDTEYVYKFKK